jgi:peptidoglycan glycosyltransferase
VNRQIVHMFGLAVFLFTILIVFTSRWTVFEAESLEEETANRRPLIEELRKPRGLIKASDGTVLARSVPEGRGGNRIFTRAYPNGPLFGHAVGYAFVEQGKAGLEASRDEELRGEENEFATIISELQEEEAEGADVITTLDPEGQQVATDALAGQNGSVVALEPKTGRVRVMVSLPQVDPNRVRKREGQIEFLNRATQSRYPPGSTFKVVTAAAALDSGEYKPESIIDGSSPKEISGVPLANSGGTDFGPVSLTDALTNSVNTVFAEVGENIGRGTLVEYMERFGFNQDPQLDYPDAQMSASGIRDAKGQILDGDSGFDVGRVAIGQGGAEGGILVTPLQMAQVAAAVGNGGVLMKPRLTDRVVGKDGRVKERIEPDEQNRVMKEETAAALTAMMARVVEEGTGTAAALSDVNVAGKTGTAEVDNATSNQAWFICFAPIEDPRMAVAVTVERTQGQGGTEAAPIAAQVLEALL